MGKQRQKKIKKPDNSVKKKPVKRDNKRSHSLLLFGYYFLRRHEITLKLLLAAHAFKPRRKKSEYHFNDEYNPNYSKYQRLIFNSEKKVLGFSDFIYYVDN